MRLENENYSLTVTEEGVIISFCEKKTGDNFVDKNGKTGTAGYTLTTEDIRKIPHEEAESYSDHSCVYGEQEVKKEKTGEKLRYIDRKQQICTEYQLTERGLRISSETQNREISEFGLNLELNFMGKKGDCYRRQFLPTSPYTSADGKHMYCLMRSPEGKILIAVAETECDGWKIKYSPYSVSHFILNFQFLASFDRLYGGSGRKKIELSLLCVDSPEAAFQELCGLYGRSVTVNLSSGGFEGEAYVKSFGGAEKYQVVSPAGKISESGPDGKIEMQEFGFHTVIPVTEGRQGLNSVVWNGGNLIRLFDKSCDAIRKPYHCDDNLCEGGCFVWAMLKNMQLHNSRAYDGVVRKELGIIMGKTGMVPRRTIVPFPSDGHAAWHIYQSDRIQEQFFGVSILLDAYRLYQEEGLLTYAKNALLELTENYMRDGMVFNGEDYTTVCCPMIPLADMACFLGERQDPLAETFRKEAEKMAAFLYRRGYSFPTEGSRSELTEPEMEDGAISCTALALLYFCTHIRYDERYAEFADEVLSFHRAWTILTPDARMQGSSFRWWETIWEGDGQGPAICAGHAWTIWQAEALFWDGILFKKDQAMLDSWNGFITNFCKTRKDGSMYSCYEADYIRGGGYEGIRKNLAQLEEKDYGVQYKIAHGYPEHTDSSLSRYAWARAAETWLKTAALLKIEGRLIPVNMRLVDGKWETEENIRQIYISPDICKEDVALKHPEGMIFLPA